MIRKSLSGLQPSSSRYMLKSQQMNPPGNLFLSVCTCILRWNHLWPFFLHLRLCCCAHHIHACCSDKGLCVQCLNTFSPWLLGRNLGQLSFRLMGDDRVRNRLKIVRTGWNWEELGINAQHLELLELFLSIAHSASLPPEAAMVGYVLLFFLFP